MAVFKIFFAGCDVMLMSYMPWIQTWSCCNRCWQLLNSCLCFDGELCLVFEWKKLIVSALSNMGHEIRASRIPKINHLVSRLCWCTVLLEGLQVQLSPEVCDRFVRFCGRSGKTSTVCHQWTRKSSPSKQGSYSATVSTGCNKTMFVLTAHYDVSITSEPAKNI